MIKILGELPKRNIGLALSGGIDSMTIANFLLRGRRRFTAFYFNHGTVHGEKAEKFVSQWCRNNAITLIKGHIEDNEDEFSEDEFSEKDFGGPQAWYRWCRYLFFSYFNEYNIIFAHHLDDVLETWLFSSFHGNPKVIPYKKGHCVRPFLLTTKEAIKAQAARYDVEWIEDESNSETDYMRNRIRHNIIPEVEKVNPGIRKNVARMVNRMYDRYLSGEKDYWKGF